MPKDLKNYFSSPQFQKYLEYLKTSGLSEASINRKLSSLTTFKKFLTKKGFLPIEKKTPLDISTSSQSTFIKNYKSKIKNFVSTNTVFYRFSVIAFLLIIISSLIYGLYSQTIQKTQKNLAYSSASSPTIPNRFLSFQGRLTDSSDNPIVSSTGITFRLYTLGSGGTELYNSNVGNSQAVTPDNNGIFSVIIGKTHGTAIPSSVFSENSEVWLEIETDSETMTPRQQIATVAYALNAETLQGLPPSASGLADTVMVLDASGNINLGETSPSIVSTAGTLAIEGQAMLLKASDGSGGSITINPDAAGLINLTTEGSGSTAVGGFINLTNANLATGNLINASIGNDNQGYNFLQFENFDVGTTNYTTRFSVGASGNVTISDSLSVGTTLSTTNISIGNTLITSTATELNFLAGIGSTNGSIVITNGSNSFNNLSQGSSGQILKSNGTDALPTWIDSSSVGVTNSYTATNGLKLNGSAFGLGGTLTQNTQIGTSSFDLTFLGINSNTQTLHLDSNGNVGIGTTDPNNALSINGNFDINGHSAFGNNATIDQDVFSGSTASTVINLEENITSASTTHTLGKRSALSLNLSSNTGGATHFTSNLSEIEIKSGNDKDIGGVVKGISGGITHYGTGEIDTVLGTEGSLNIIGTGTVTNGIGTYGLVINQGGTIETAKAIRGAAGSTSGTTDLAYAGSFEIFNYGGTITEAHAVHIDTPLNYGTITNNYGLYIDDQSSAGSSKSFNLYSNGTSAKNYFAGLVGIGTTNPSYKLEVNGDLGVGTTLTTASLNLTSTAIGSSSIPSFLSGNSGLIGYLDTSSWDKDASDDYDYWSLQTEGTGTTSISSGNTVNFTAGVGISLAQTGSTIEITNNSVGTTYSFDNGLSDLGSNIIGLGGTLTQNTQIGTSSFSLSFLGINSNTQTLHLASNGNVGIGTTDPSYKLEVSEDGYFGTNLTVGGTLTLSQGASDTYILQSNASGNATWVNPTSAGIGTTYDAGSGLTLASEVFSLGGTLSSDVRLNIGNTEAFFIDSSTGNIGIGTTVPSKKLEVTGQSKFTSTSYPVVDIYRDTKTSAGNIYGGAKLERLLTGGTATDGTGIGFYFKAPDSTGQSTLAGMFGGALSTVANGSEVGDIVFGASWRGADPYQNKHLIIRATGTSTGNVLIPNGNVGIGTTSPSYKLEVAGSGLFSSLGVGATSTSAFNVSTDASIGTNLSVGGTLVLPQGATAGYVLQSDASGNASWISAPSSVGASTVPFSGITTGINTQAIMTVSAGSSLTYTSTGIINASQLQSATWGSPLAIGSTTPASGTFTTLTGTNLSIGNSASITNSLSVGTTLSTDTLFASGNVGIGTTGPGATLDVNGYANALGTRLDWGSVGAPSYSFKSNTATGMYLPVSNNIGFQTDGTEKVRINSSGNVGIGTTDPETLFQIDAPFGDNVANIPFSFNRNTNAGGFASSAIFNMNTSDDNYDDGEGVRIRLNIGGVPFANSIVDFGAQRDTADNSGAFVVRTYDTGTAYERFRITHDGNVGIGTTDPKYKLEVVGSGLFTSLGVGATSSSAFNVSTDASIGTNLSVGGTLTLPQGATDGYILQSDASGNSTWIDPTTAGIGTTYSFVNGLSDLGSNVIGLGGTLTQNTSIGTSSFSLSFLGINSNTQTLYLASNGNVGIGTTNPTKKLVIQDSSTYMTIGDNPYSAGYGPQITTNSNTIVMPQTLWFVDSTAKFTATGGTFTLQGDNNVLFNYWNGSAYITGLKINKTAGQVQSFTPNGLYVENSVGIGTSTPNYKLEVAGSGLFSSLGVGATSTSAFNVSTDASIGTNLSVGGTLVLPQGATAGYVLQSDASGNASWISAPSSVGASTVPFSGITTGTNTQATMTVGAGSSLTYTSTGIINANQLAGLAYDNLPYVNNTTDTTLIRSGAGPYTLALNLGSTNTWTALQTFTNSIGVTGNSIFTDNLSIGKTISTANIYSSGRVGIGTATPADELDVNGTIRALNVVSSGSGGHPTGIGTYVETYVYNGNIGRLFAFDGSSYYDLAIGDWNSANPNIMLKVGGNVGIGVGAPQNRLDIEGSVAIGASYSGSYSAPSNGLIVQGSVGIGTTSPSSVLAVIGDGSFSTSLSVGTSLQATDYLSGDGTLGATTSTNGLTFKDGLFTSGSITGFDNYVQWFATDGDGDTYPITASDTLTFVEGTGVNIDFTGDDQLTISSIGTTYSFVNGLSDLGSNVIGLGGTLTQNTQIGTSSFSLSFLGINSNTQTLYLDSNGNVGIGTTNPSYSLDISGDLGVGSTAYFASSVGIGIVTPGRNLSVYNNGGSSTIQIVNNTTGSNPSDGSYIQASGNDFLIGNQESGGLLRLFVDNDAAKGLTINAGSVGIGTTNPSYKLEVNGDLGVGTTLTTASLNLTSTAIGSSSIPSFLSGNSGLIGYLDTSSWDKDASDDYDYWSLQTEGTGTTSISSTNTVNFTAGVGISLAQTGSTIEITNSDVGTTYSFVNGLKDLGSNVIGLGGTLTQNTQIGTSSFSLSFLGINSNTQTLYLASNGNVGIGTTNPTSKLEIGGASNISNASGNLVISPADNLVITSGVGITGNLTIGGTLVSVGSTNTTTNLSADYLDGLNSTYFINIGQTESLPYVNNATNSTLTRSGSGPYTLGLNLGNANTWTDKQTFTSAIGVTGNSTFTNSLSIGGTLISVGSTNTTTNLSADYLDGLNSTYFINIGQTGNLQYVNNATNSTLTRSGSGPYTLGLNLGNANTWTAKQTFTSGVGVTGNLTIGGTLTLPQGASDGYILQSDASGNASWVASSIGSTYAFINGLSNNIGSTNVVGLGGTLTQNTQIGTSSFSLSFLGINSNTQTLHLNSNGSVGIGTTSPLSTLDIKGNISLTGGDRTIQTHNTDSLDIKTYDGPISILTGAHSRYNDLSIGYSGYANDDFNIFFKLGGGGSIVINDKTFNTYSEPMFNIDTSVIGNAGAGSILDINYDVVGNTGTSYKPFNLDYDDTSSEDGIINYGYFVDIDSTGSNDGNRKNYGFYADTTLTGGSSGTRENYAAYFKATGSTASTSKSIGIYASASAADNNYAGIFDSGFVGIGTTAPTYKLEVVGSGLFTSLGVGATSTSAFNVSTNASIGTNLSIGGTLTLSQGASNGYILQSDASGNASWVSTAGIGTTYLAGSGLSLSSNTFSIGGTLTEDTIFTIGDTTPFFIDYETANIGIGITISNFPLHVGTTAADGTSAYFAGYIQAQKFSDLTDFDKYFLNPANSAATDSTLQAHRDGSIRFNAYYDSGWKRSILGSAAKIQNFNNGLMLGVASTAAANAAITDWESQGMFIDVTGSIGIGTTDPDTKLEINGDVVFNHTGSNSAFIVNASNSSLDMQPGFSVYLPSSGEQKGFQLYNDTPGTNWAWSSFEYNIGGNGKPGLSLGSGSGASARDVNIYRDSADILKTDDSLVVSNNLTILSGNVGIGTTAPNSTLFVNSTSSGANLAIGHTNTYKAALALADGGTDTYGPGGGAYALRLYESYGWNFTLQNHANSAFRIQPYNSNTYTDSALFLVESGGNVGIGTTNPSAKLEVAGTTSTITNSSGDITINAASDIILSDNIGIKTTNPLKALHIAGTGNNDFILHSGASNSDANSTLESLGTYRISMGVFSNAHYMYYTDSSNVARYFTHTGSAIDLAEWFPVGQESMLNGQKTLQKGDLLCTSSSGKDEVVACQNEYASNIVGIVSTQPWSTMGNIDMSLPMGTDPVDMVQNALAGRVPLKIIVTDQQINKGSPLTSSSTPGVSMKATKAGPIVAKALESTSDWNNSTCTPVNSLQEIIWPEDDGTNPSKPCYKLPNDNYVGKIMAIVNISWYDPDIYLSETGQIYLDYNIDPQILSDLNIVDLSSEIYTANYHLTNTLGNTITRIAQFAKIASAKIDAGLITTKNLIADNIVSKLSVSEKVKTNLISPLNNTDTIIIDADTNINGTLTTKDIATTTVTTDKITTNNLESQDATVTGTLYANQIISNQGSFTDIMADKISSLRTEVRKLIDTSIATTSNDITGSSLFAQSSDWSTIIATDSAIIDADLSISHNLIVAGQLMIQGQTQMADAFVSGLFTAGQVAIRDNFIETTASTLHIQPSGVGTIYLLSDTMVIADNGSVTINGDLTINGNLVADNATFDNLQAQEASVSGSLFANLIDALDLKTKNASVSGTLAANTIETSTVKIATDSASTVIAESGFGLLATSSAQVATNATAGTSTLPVGKTEIIVRNNKVTANSMIYLTPAGSTQNQVVYIKEKYISPTPTPESTSSATPESYFIIALDQPLVNNLDINWWIIN